MSEVGKRQRVRECPDLGRISLKPNRWLVNGKLSAFGRDESVLKIELLAQALRIRVLTATNRMSVNAVGSTRHRNALLIGQN
jgi:hypothetical protein